MFLGQYNFVITDDGNWKAHFRYKYDQNVENPWDGRPEDRKGPFYAQDYSRMQSNAALRARKLAKPDWDHNEGRSQSDFGDLLSEEEFLNENIDFSFEYEFKDKGEWRRGTHNVKVSDKISAGVNADNIHLGGKPEGINISDSINIVNIMEPDSE